MKNLLIILYPSPEFFTTSITSGFWYTKRQQGEVLLNYPTFGGELMFSRVKQKYSKSKVLPVLPTMAIFWQMIRKICYQACLLIFQVML